MMGQKANRARTGTSMRGMTKKSIIVNRTRTAIIFEIPTKLKRNRTATAVAHVAQKHKIKDNSAQEHLFITKIAL